MKRFLVAIVALLLISAEVRAGVLVRFQMNAKIGTLDVELFEQDKPTTVSNFLAYIKAGRWHDTIAHRWISGQILQGGIFDVPHRADLMTSWNDEPVEISYFPAIPFERDVGRFFSNTYGTIAMARVGTDTNSATASWFFNVGNNPALDTQDGGYTVFGRVVRGTNVLDRFIGNSGISNIFHIAGTDVPVYSEDHNNVFYLNMDITVLTAHIQIVRAGKEISWNSVEGRPNIVEFTRTVPPVWQTLTTVPGSGARMTAVDSSTDPMRQYRVRIDYTAP